ncbi:hypothetical protein [Argonema antarcticum]|uniref:hypothetical protein n=1 Tax=Argonema antarcticum TaxID=2942763 RepID=UPI002013514D|nr:hypothetical protein [Argonema antarcticum]MCL1475100.1 hypothetical protein [Argonema antarcticum A004/B2]
MTEAQGNSFITDPAELHYIWDVVNRVLDRKHELGSIQDFQSALKEASLSPGREIQINLVNQNDRLVGFNFSFSNQPDKTTVTIPFKQELELSRSGGSILPQPPQNFTIDIAAKKEKGNLLTQTPPGQLAVTPPLQTQETRVLPKQDEEQINSPSPGLKLNPNLARIAAYLASRSEIDGLWLTGTTLKTVTTLAQSLETENKPDIQFLGNAVIKRFEQVLPQQFAELTNGSSAKPFNWKDPHSGQQYRFEFYNATCTKEGQPLTPATLKGFRQSGNSKQPVFSASLIDAKRDRWLIEQCDFTTSQLHSITACNRSTSEKTPKSLENAL